MMTVKAKYYNFTIPPDSEMLHCVAIDGSHETMMIRGTVACDSFAIRFDRGNFKIIHPSPRRNISREEALALMNTEQSHTTDEP